MRGRGWEGEVRRSYEGESRTSLHTNIVLKSGKIRLAYNFTDTFSLYVMLLLAGKADYSTKLI